ncbi:MAG TPA: dihydrofolate reductase family protein [Capillimicrobium sp.]|nr:dihydrofolate reductase family protein [Capillimicrobium sp.]
MATVVYSSIVSLDGYFEDADGRFDFAAPDEELHRAANEQARAVSAYLFGRRLYETMEEPWTAAAAKLDELPAVEAEFASLYLETPRYVFSDTLERVGDGVELVRGADAVEVVTRLKAELDGELALGGAGLAASLIDLVDEFRLFVVPVAVGGGKPFFPLGTRLRLRLMEHRAFASGAMFLRYAVAG